jgi:hypothetical protein
LHFFIGTGIVGGRMPTYLEMGRQAANAVDAVIDGSTPAAPRWLPHVHRGGQAQG